LACAGDDVGGGDGGVAVAEDGESDGPGTADGRAFDASGVADGWDWAAGDADGPPVEEGGCWAAAIPCK
jgi:hypothetical protein